MNYNEVFCKNIASTIVHCICIIEKLYTETPDRPNIKSGYLSILSLFNNRILGDRKLKIRVTFFTGKKVPHQMEVPVLLLNLYSV